VVALETARFSGAAIQKRSYYGPYGKKKTKKKKKGKKKKAEKRKNKGKKKKKKRALFGGSQPGKSLYKKRGPENGFG